MKRKVQKISTVSLFLAILFGVTSVSAVNLPVEKQVSNEYALADLPQNIQSLLHENQSASSLQKDDDVFSLTANNEDGSKTTTVFSVPVKYENKAGEIDFIDTSIVSNGLLEKMFQGYQYKNKANSVTTEFSTSADKGIRFTVDDSKLKMKPSSLQRSVSNAKMSARIEKMAPNADLGDAFVYENVYGTDTSIKYYNTSTGIKEDIILNKNIGKNKFDFEINTDGDLPILSEDASMIQVYDKDDPDSIKYYFADLYSYDSYVPNDTPDSFEQQYLDSDIELETETVFFQHNTFDCHYELTDLGNSNYKVTIVVSYEWLNHPETVYPVTIDPTVNANSIQTNIDDTYVMEANPNSNYYMANRLRFGNYNNTNYNSGRCYSYLRFITMPSLSNITVTEATLKMKLLSGTNTAHNIRAWRVDQSWVGSNMTWNNKPSNAETTDRSYDHNNCTHYEVRIDHIVNKWYNGYTNYGVLFNYNDETIKDLNSVYSSDCGVADNLPTLSIKYVTNSALEPDGTYYIRNKRSGHYLDATNKGDSGTNVIQYTFNGSTNQQWKFFYLGNGYYVIRTGYNYQLALDVYNNYENNEANVDVWSITTTNSASSVPDYAQWKLISNGDGSYRIASKCSIDSKVLTVQGGSSASGANVFQYQYNGSGNDEWFLEFAFTNAKVFKTSTNLHLNNNYVRLYAKNYAIQHGENRNPDYISYTGTAGDCTNFISQCLYAGCMPFVGAPTNSSEATNQRQENLSYWFYKPEYNGLLDKNGISNTWANANSSHKHWGINNGVLGRGFQYIQYENVEDIERDFKGLQSSLKEGDLFYQMKNESSANHAMIITGISANDIIYAQHTDDKINCSLKDLINRYRSNASDWAFVKVS